MAFVVAAPAQAALPAAPAPPAQQAVGTASSTAASASSTAASAAGAAQQQAVKGVAAAKQVAPRVASSPAGAPRVTLPRVAPPRVSVPGVAPPRVSAPPQPPPASAPRVTLPAPPAPVDTSAVQGVGRETQALPEKLVQPLSDAPRPAALDDAVALLGNALRQIAPPLGSLLAPVKPLLGGLADLNGLDFPDLVAVVSPGKAQTLGAEHHALAPPSLRAVPPAQPAGSAPAHTFQAASARPPAAEVGGRPVSPPPRTAPAPVAGGATALFFSGGTFVPFLGLLVLAALAAPRLMRRLDELPAFVRPAPFLCALERPG
jgi:hypothetical protein